MEGLASLAKHETRPDLRHLFEQARSGRREAYEQIIGHFEERVMRMAAFLTRNWDDAQDVAQEVYVKIIRKAPAVQQWDNLEGWVYRVTVNAARDWQRKQRFWLPLKELAGWAAPGGDVESREIRGRLAHALGALSFRERAAFVLSPMQELPTREVAQILGCRQTTVRGYLHSARRKLRREFSDFREER